MKVCRKSTIIEAFHFTEESINHPVNWPNWLFLAASKNKNSKNCFYFESVKSGVNFVLVGNNGLQTTVNFGDYILCDNGRLFVRSSSAFHAYWSEVK